MLRGLGARVTSLGTRNLVAASSSCAARRSAVSFSASAVEGVTLQLRARELTSTASASATSSLYGSARFQSSTTTPPPQQPHPAPPKKGAKSTGPLPLGCAHVDTLNYPQEVQRCRAPVMLYFHVESHEQVRAYTQDLLKQVGQANTEIAKKLAEEGPASAAADAMEKAKAQVVSELGVKLALINIEREPQMAQLFRIQPDMFPIIYFLYDGKIVDKMVGIVPEAHIQEAVQALVKFAAEQRAAAASSAAKKTTAGGTAGAGGTAPGGGSGAGGDKPAMMDTDDENVMTLVHTGMRKLQEKDLLKGEQLFLKAVGIATPAVEALRKQLGLDTKKMTPEVMEKLKKDPHYLALPQAHTGLAMVELGRKNMEKASEFSKKIRLEFPWAIREQRFVADALARIDMLQISGYDSDRDTYVNLLKRDEYLNDPVKFYTNNCRLAVAHYFERHHDQALEELLKLVRVEAKLLPELKKAGLCDSLATSPARKILFLMFEGLGNDSPAVITARRKLAAFL